MMKNKLKSFLTRYPRLYSFAKELYQFGHLVQVLVIKRDINYIRCLISAKSRSPICSGDPIALTVEPANICNLQCPVCETGCGELQREAKMMSFSDFKHVLDQFGQNLKKVFLYYMGESFLNKDIYQMIRYSADRDLFVSICTNGEPLDPEKIISTGIAEIQFQIGGTTQEVHQIYRKKGHLDRTLNAVKSLIKLKSRHKDELSRKKYPLRILLGLILMKHNEHQIDDFIRLAKELEVDEYQIINPCVRTIEQGKRYLPEDKNRWIYELDAFSRGKLQVKNPPHNYCEWLYGSVTVQVNGDVVPCCRDTTGRHVLGNLFKQELAEVWNGPRFKAFRQAISVNQKNMDICKLCEGYGISSLT